MLYERVGLLLPEETNIQDDAQLAESFGHLHLGQTESYKMLTPPAQVKAEAAQAFVRGESPDLTVEHIDQSTLDTRLAELKSWKSDLLDNDETNPDVVQAYRWRINEDIANIYMIKASARGDMRSFARWNKFIYGQPNEAIYRGALDWFATDAESILGEAEPGSALAQSAQKVIDQLAEKRGSKAAITPQPEVFNAVRDDHIREGGYYALLLSGVELPESGPVVPEQGNPILRHVVSNNLQSDYDVTPVSGTVWGVSHSTSQVEHPETYKMPVNRFVGLGLGHEIGSHLLERVNGQRGPLALASQGLDRYESGNEGRAVIREQVVYDSFEDFGRLVRWRDIMRRHVAISYAVGVGEDAPQTAESVYKFVNAIDEMYQLKIAKEGAEDQARQKAQAKTTALLTRVLKGTDGTGGAYLKDIVYLEGNVACWSATPEAVSSGDLGKFDITNDRHIVLLQKLGLLPDNE